MFWSIYFTFFRISTSHSVSKKKAPLIGLGDFFLFKMAAKIFHYNFTSSNLYIFLNVTKNKKNYLTIIPNDMPNLNVIRRVLKELPPFEISTYLPLTTIFQKWRPLFFYSTNICQIPKSKKYLIWCILLTCKIITKYSIYIQRNWPYTIFICP